MTPDHDGNSGGGTAASSMQGLRLFSIHVITASGAGCAMMAMLAAGQLAWPVMFGWLGLALLLDAIDGPMARRVRLWDAMPRWSGTTLDLVVDFVTYVFVPAYAIAASGLMPSGFGAPAAVAIVIVSALYFADNEMKLDDNCFKGFPAIWNAAAFYLFLIAPPPWIGLLSVAALVAMTFLPIPFLHPIRVVRLRGFNIALLVIWSLLAMIAIAHGMSPGAPVTAPLCLIGIYILCGGVMQRLLPGRHTPGASG